MLNWDEYDEPKIKQKPQQEVQHQVPEKNNDEIQEQVQDN